MYVYSNYDVSLISDKPDSVIVSSTKTSSHVGESSGRLTCNATGGYPTPTLKIYYKQSGSSVVVVSQGQYKIRMSKEDNQAEYYCEARVTGYPALSMDSARKKYNVTCK